MSTQDGHTGGGGDTPSRLEEFKSLLRQAYRRLRRKYLLASLLFTLLAPIAGFALLSLLEHEFYLPAWTKSALVVLSVLAAAGIAFALMRRRKIIDFRSFYLDFCEARNLPVLRHALDLEGKDREDASPRLRKVAIRNNLESAGRQADLRSELDAYLGASSNQRLLKRSWMGAGGSLVLLLAAVLLFGSAAERALHFWKSYDQPNPYQFTVLPGDFTMEQGSLFQASVVFHGERPENIGLAFKTDVEEAYRHRPGTWQRPPDGQADVANSSGTRADGDTARFEAVSLQTDGTYYIEMDGFRSERYSVDVQLRPRFESLNVTVDPPAYTGLDSTVYRYPFSRIEAMHGSQVRISGATNKPGTSVTLRRSTEDDTAYAQPEQETAFAHGFTLTGSDSLSFEITDDNGLTNQNRFAFVMEPVADRYPWAEIISPEGDPEMSSVRPLTVAWEAGDDFGLRSATLDWELQKAFTDSPQTGSMPLSYTATSRSGELEWDVPRLEPGPRDRLTFRIRAVDNDPFNGPKEGFSRTVTIRFPSVTESMEDISRQESGVEESLENISRNHEQIQQEYEQLRQQLRENPETNWEQRQSLDQMEQQRQEMQKQVEDLNQKFQELRRQVEQNNALSPETMESYRELEKLMQEVDDPAFQEAMEQLRNAMDSMSQDQLREALENYEFNEQTYQERLQRTLELFRSLKLNSNLDQLARSLEDLAEQERELSESPETGQEEVQRQEAIEEDLQQLRQEIDSLGNDAPQRAREQVSELQNSEGARMDSLRQQVRDNLEQMQELQQQQGASPDSTSPDSATQDSTGQNQSGGQRGGQGGQSGGTQQQQQIQNQQRQIGQDMQQSAEAMRSARQQMNQQGRNINFAALQYILFSLIDLSDRQEELAQETEYLSNRSQAFVEKARTQSTIRDHFSQLSDSLFAISSELPSFSNTINVKKAEVERQLGNAVDFLAERNKSSASFALRESLGGINDLATTIAELMDQLRRSQNQSMSMQQFTQQMQQMSGSQQQLNEQLQQMINDVAGDRLTQGQMERLNQLAEQQRQIREQMQKLQQSGALEPGDEILSEMERMAEQMEQSINDLRGGQTDPSVAQRQQNILSRMLSAQKAVQERGEKEEREGTTATDVPRATPPDVTLEELQKQIRTLLNDPERTRFKQDYQQLIQRYFELLKELEDDTL